MKNAINIIALLILSLMVACQDKKENIQEIRDVKELFKNKSDLKHSKLPILSNSINYLFSMHIYKKFLILENRAKEYLFTVIDLETNQIIGNFAKVGNGLDEFTFPTSLQIIPNQEGRLGLYQRQKFKYSELDLEKWLKEKKESYTHNTSTFDVNFQNLLKLNDETFVGYGIFEKRYAMAQKNGKVKKLLHPYPFQETQKNVSFGELAMAYQLQLLLHNKTSYLASATKSSPNIDFCRISNDSLILSKKYHIRKADFESTSGTQLSATMKKENAFGFVSATHSERYIYLLYSGKTSQTDNEASIRGKDIFVFDWEGNPIRHYELDMKINCLAIDLKDNKLYGFLNEKEPKILIFDLK